MVIDDIAGLRNNLVHEYGYLTDVEGDRELQVDLKDAIEAALVIIESVEG